MKKSISILFLITFFLVVSAAPIFAGFLSFKSGQETQTPQNTAKVNHLNEQAVELFEQGRFQEAQELWEKAIGLLENSAKSGATPQKAQDVPVIAEEDPLPFDEDKELRVDEVDKYYEMAVSLFKGEKYVAAKKVFERIEGIIPDYKASRNYLTILDHKIRQAQQTLGGAKFKETSLARREERVEWEQILEASRMELEQKLEEPVEPL
jgi:tetratricopeptide (TPR) repeat protein